MTLSDVKGTAVKVCIQFTYDYHSFKPFIVHFVEKGYAHLSTDEFADLLSSLSNEKALYFGQLKMDDKIVEFTPYEVRRGFVHQRVGILIGEEW